MMRRYDKEDLDSALRVLREGGIILYPTDTVWGIGCDATNAEAVARIFRLKQREDSKSMLVLLDAPGRLQGYVSEVPDIAWELLDATLNGVNGEASLNGENGGAKPLTIIYPGARNLASNLIAEDGSVGIRITEEKFSNALCAGLKRPIVSTSANISGQAGARYYEEIAEEIRQGVDYICRYRQDDTEPKQPSSIIKLGVDGTFVVIRK